MIGIGLTSYYLIKDIKKKLILSKNEENNIFVDFLLSGYEVIKKFEEHFENLARIY